MSLNMEQQLFMVVLLFCAATLQTEAAVLNGVYVCII